MNPPSQAPVAIIGAGPYGVSIAAHLRFRGIPFRIFGKPMQRWRQQMPKGMFLKSEGRASSLSDPFGRYTLAQHCAAKGLPYRDWGMPVSLEVFSQYALSFQQRCVPSIEQELVAKVETIGEGFELKLTSGEAVKVARVIVATGMDYSEYVPPELAGLPSEMLSHSGHHHDLSQFQGQQVVVIGGGQSALETAALLSEHGASVCLLVRQPTLAWNAVPKNGTRSVYERLRYPTSNLGVGLELWFHCEAPMLFRHLPQPVRLEKVRTVLGPAGAWWLKDRVLGRVRIILGHWVQRAEHRGGLAVLQAVDQNRQTLELAADHVIAATGYQFDLQRLPFLSQSLKSQLRSEESKPVLSANFESSVPGLYFAGFASATHFGPVMRFLQGTGYTARRISGHVSERCRTRGPQRKLTFADAVEFQEF